MQIITRFRIVAERGTGMSGAEMSVAERNVVGMVGRYWRFPLPEFGDIWSETACVCLSSQRAYALYQSRLVSL